MPSTHQQLLYHIIFSTKNRKPYLANEDHRAKVFSYLAGIAKNLDGFALEIRGWQDHVHLLVRIPAKLAVSDFVGRLKSNSSKHVNETSGLIKKFVRQEGFGAFTVSLSQKAQVALYIYKNRSSITNRRRLLRSMFDYSKSIRLNMILGMYLIEYLHDPKLLCRPFGPQPYA